MKKIGLTQRGVALIAVLWLVSAMGLIITGIVKAVRSEIQIAGLQRQTVVTNALADAAILLALQSLHAQKIEPRNMPQFINVSFEGQTNEVSVRALNGLIDINNASIPLLADMLRYAGGLKPETAQALAQTIVETRQLKTAKGTAQGFDAIEDLLRVPGMTYDLYAKIKKLVSSDLKDGSGRVNPMTAPVEVLQILCAGDSPRAAALAAKRNLDPNTTDTSFLNPNFIEMTPSSSLQLQVSIALPSGGASQKTWLVYWGEDPRSGLPWRVLGTQQSLQYPAQPGN